MKRIQEIRYVILCEDCGINCELYACQVNDEGSVFSREAILCKECFEKGEEDGDS